MKGDSAGTGSRPRRPAAAGSSGYSPAARCWRQPTRCSRRSGSSGWTPNCGGRLGPVADHDPHLRRLRPGVPGDRPAADALHADQRAPPPLPPSRRAPWMNT